MMGGRNLYSTCVIDISLSYKVKYPLYTMGCTWEKLINKQPLLIQTEAGPKMENKQKNNNSHFWDGSHNRMLTKTLRK